MKVAPGSIEPPDEEQRGQNHQKNDVRIQRDLRQVAEEGENHATQKEHDGIRNFEFLRERRQPSDEEHEEEKRELEVVNACGLHGGVSRDFRLTQRITDAPPRMGHPFRS